MDTPFAYRTAARSPATFLAFAAVWAALIAAWVWLDAAIWILAVIAAFTLPALYDLVMGPEAGLTLEADEMTWFSGRRTATLPYSEMAHMRLDTRLDFSVRATAVLQTGRKIRLPFEATPPHRAFEEALQARGLKVERHHFQLFQ
ncbi:MAG: hypothetical protein AAF744_02290 [Pseudomonadota bacterium]